MEVPQLLSPTLALNPVSTRNRSRSQPQGEIRGVTPQPQRYCFKEIVLKCLRALKSPILERGRLEPAKGEACLPERDFTRSDKLSCHMQERLQQRS